MRLLHLASTLSFISLALAWTTYTVPHSSGKDDTPALAAAFSANFKLHRRDDSVPEGRHVQHLDPHSFPVFEERCYQRAGEFDVRF